MLVAVRVEIAGGERGVRLHVVGELDDLDVQAVLRRDRLHDFHDLRVRTAGDADLDRVFGVSRDGGERALRLQSAAASLRMNRRCMVDFSYRL